MKNIVLLVLVLVLGACASQKAKKEVKQEAAEIMPVINPNLQFERAVAMIGANPDLTTEQKNKLVGLIKAYGSKMYENKEKEGQYRAVLLDEMLKNDVKNNDKITAAKKNITSINKENSGLVEGFVQDFKETIGNSARFHQPVMMEVIMVE